MSVCVSGKGEAAKRIGFETRTVGFHRQQLCAVPVAPMARDCFVVAARSHGGAVGSKWCDRCGSADVEVVRFRSGSMCAPACRSANQARSWPRGTDRARPKTRHRSPRHNVIVRATTSRSANQARSWPRGTDRARPKTRHRSPRHNVIVRATTSRPLAGWVVGRWGFRSVGL